MFFRATVTAFMGLALCLLALQATNGQDVKKDKNTQKDKKFEIPKDAIQGVIKGVDMAKANFTITLKDKKERTFIVDKATEFYGPKGGDRGTGPAGLKDECMAVGYEIHVVPTKDGKTAKDVYLPVRKSDPKDKK